MAVPVKSMKQMAFAFQRLKWGHVAWNTGVFFLYLYFPNRRLTEELE